MKLRGHRRSRRPSEAIDRPAHCLAVVAVVPRLEQLERVHHQVGGHAARWEALLAVRTVQRRSVVRAGSATGRQPLPCSR